MQTLDQGGTAAPPPRVIALGPELLLQGVVIPSFAQFAVTGEDNLRVTTIGSIVGMTVNVHGRFLDAAQGKTIPFNYVAPVQSNRVAISTLFALGTGYVLNLTAFVSGASPLIGQCFVIVQLIRGLGGATFLLGTLLSGYVTSTQALGFPGSPILPSTTGEPPTQAITPDVVVPGSNFTFSVPAGARWDVQGVTALLTTDIVVPARTVFLNITDPGGNFIAQIPPDATQPANAAHRYSWAPAFPVYALGAQGVHILPLPLRTLLPAGSTIASQIANLDVGDSLTQIEVSFREWLEVS
jgi:hypothetical protein